MERDYEDALHLLNSRKTKPRSSLDDMRGSDDMVEWLGLLGYSEADLNGLNSIHVAGTNGKGSTCAFAASLLMAYGRDTGYPRKVGLYTSPHMSSIRERIRINGEPISEEHFSKCFFEIWDKLPNSATPSLDIPRYLQLLALLSFHVFITEKVDVAVYETHLGGEFDATNVLKTPLVTAITPIAMDHVNLLGPTVQKIAWHKAGIFKPESLALSALQEDEVVAVLQRRAAEKGVVIKFVGLDPALPINIPALNPKAQKMNCSLAIAVVQAWLSVILPAGQSSLQNSVVSGIEQFSWRGRYERINDGNCQWFLDGAHNEAGLTHAVEWFAGTSVENPSHTVQILIFSHFSARDGTTLLRGVAKCLRDKNTSMQYVILTTYDERKDGQVRIDRNSRNRFSQEIQERYASVWKELEPEAVILIERTIENALDMARKIGAQNNGIKVLITGSLHLVSGALSLLE